MLALLLKQKHDTSTAPNTWSLYTAAGAGGTGTGGTGTGGSGTTTSGTGTSGTGTNGADGVCRGDCRGGTGYGCSGQCEVRHVSGVSTVLLVIRISQIWTYLEGWEDTVTIS